MKLLTIGDSFTYGLELDDPSRCSWPVLLSEKIGSSLINVSSGGASNDMMFRECVEHITMEQYDIVIVSWSDPSRLEVSRHGRPFSVNYSSRMLDLVPWIEEYYRHSHDDALCYRRTMSMILSLQSLLKEKNQKYIFASTFGIQDLNQKMKNQCSEMQSQVDSRFYLGWPTEGLVEWMGDCSKGPGGHPLESGHQKIFEKFYEHIRYLGWIP